MSARLIEFRLKAGYYFRKYGSLPAWTKAELDDIRERAHRRAEEFARYAS